MHEEHKGKGNGSAIILGLFSWTCSIFPELAINLAIDILLLYEH